MNHTSFAPNRLGHVNLFVSNLERSIAFYRDIAGIELVRREPGIRGGFHSNGNTHHDVGLIEVASGARHGIGGFQQVSSHRAMKPGLNHFGWEMPSEADLIQALKRAKAAGLAIVNYSDHQISHSVYVVDPDGNYHEFYADMVEAWRSIFNLEHEDLVTSGWEWEKSEPGRGPVPADPNDRRMVEHAVFHPRRITHATLAVKRHERMIDFLTNVAGLSVIASEEGRAMFRSAQSPFDLLVIPAAEGAVGGLRAASFEVEDEQDLVKSAALAVERGIAKGGMLDFPHKRSVVVTDPDGLEVEFYWRRAGQKPRLPQPDVAKYGERWLFAA